MKRILNISKKIFNEIPRPNPSDSERGFAPAGNAQQGVNVQFNPEGQVTPSGDGDSGGGKAESNE